MGCASSKSTPTVESNTTNSDDLAKTLLNNGKSMAMNSQQEMMQKIDEYKKDISDSLSLDDNEGKHDDMMESRVDSPMTERADHIDDMQVTDISEQANDTSEENQDDNTNVMNEPMIVEATEPMDDSISDKPPTPMPEDSDSISDHYATARSLDRSTQTNTDTIDSNVMRAVCTSAAKLAMDDTLKKNGGNLPSFDSNHPHDSQFELADDYESDNEAVNESAHESTVDSEDAMSDDNHSDDDKADDAHVACGSFRKLRRENGNVNFNETNLKHERRVFHAR